MPTTAGCSTPCGDALQRFAQGVFMVWYPVVSKPGAAALVQGLKALAPRGWLHARLELQQPDAQGFGLAGSGVVSSTRRTRCTGSCAAAVALADAGAGAACDGASYRLEQREA